jgi:hypothetical protein
VSLAVENITDFLAAYIIGNLMQMAFRFWAFRRWVFPDELGDDPDRALGSTLTAGGIVEALEDEIEARETRRGVVTPLRRPGTPPAA